MTVWQVRTNYGVVIDRLEAESITTKTVVMEKDLRSYKMIVGFLPILTVLTISQLMK